MNSTFALEQLMRWYGPNDAVPLAHIAQAGCTGVVSALHAIPVGEVWTTEAIQAYKDNITAAHLTWTVVESLPVHEDIKKGDGQRDLYIERYKECLRNLSACGIKVVTYNFMPILDWVRTDTAYQLPNGAEALMFNKADYAVFDLFLLQRPNAEADYTPEELAKYTTHFKNMATAEKQRIFKNVLMGLPGSEVPFTPAQVLDLLNQYQHINREKLKSNLFYFLREVAPVAESVGIQLAIHPDDPPYSVLGLPRIMSTHQDILDMITAVPNKANGLCFCTGSYGARPDNDIVAMLKHWKSRVYFLHLRNTKRDSEGNFMEDNHLDGDTNMFAVMQEVVKLMQEEQRSIPMRPDHGHKMLDDLGKTTFSGYSAIGRLKGLAELRGLEYGIRSFLQLN
jgi:mannonate dehydratase